MTQMYDRFAGQNLAIALAAVRAESLQPPASYSDPAGQPVAVNNEGEWAVVRSAPGGTWAVERESARQVQAPAIKQPLTAGALVAILVGLALVAFIIVSFVANS